MQSTEYLNQMLANWNAFFREHKNVEQAIRDVLEENERLKKQLHNKKAGDDND